MIFTALKIAKINSPFIEILILNYDSHRKRKVNDKNDRKPNKKEKISINHKLLSGKPEEFIAKNSVNNHSYF
jgi:hypothetical protein